MTANDTGVVTIFDHLLDEYQQAQGALLEAQDELDKIKNRLIGAVEATGVQSVGLVNDEDEVFKVTVVSGETTKIDEFLLRAAIGGRAYNSLTVRKLDMKKVEKAIADGTLSVEVLADVAEVKSRAKFLKITRGDA